MDEEFWRDLRDFIDFVLLFDFMLFVDFFEVTEARNGFYFYFYFYFEVGIGEAFFGLVEED